MTRQPEGGTPWGRGEEAVEFVLAFSTTTSSVLDGKPMQKLFLPAEAASDERRSWLRRGLDCNTVAGDELLGIEGRGLVCGEFVSLRVPLSMS